MSKCRAKSERAPKVSPFPLVLPLSLFLGFIGRPLRGILNTRGSKGDTISRRTVRQNNFAATKREENEKNRFFSFSRCRLQFFAAFCVGERCFLGLVFALPPLRFACGDSFTNGNGYASDGCRCARPGRLPLPGCLRLAVADTELFNSLTVVLSTVVVSTVSMFSVV